MHETKRSIGDYAHELRLHMIAGLFWYIISLISWSSVAVTFKWLTEKVGAHTAIAIDTACLVIVFWAVISLLRLAMPSGTTQSSDLFAVVQVWPESSAAENITYKNKVRIAFRNDSNESLEIRTYWIANGNVSLQLPEVMKLRREIIKGSYRQMSFEPTETPTVRLEPGWTATTWIGLGKKLTDAEFARARDHREFGTLALEVAGRPDGVLLRA
jgi:hypothetical protein